MTLIDTSAWIELLRTNGDAQAKRRVAAMIELGEAAHCGPIVFELVTGARPAEMPDVREALSFSVLLDFPTACWERAGEVEKVLRARGVTVPRDDIFVAAAALHHDVPILAWDSHFALMCDRGGIPLRLAARRTWL